MINIIKIAKKILATYLTQQQRDMLQYSINKRKQGMDFGEKFSNQRTYIHIGKISEKSIEAPREIIQLLNDNEYSKVDYSKGLAQKYNKKLNKFTQKSIGKIFNQVVKDRAQLSVIKRLYDQRLGTSKKDYQKIDFTVVITHKPEDIAGMSTNRNWTSCMRLPGVGSNDGGGEFYYTSLNQVQYGGMCAYLIDEEDRTINRPYARIAIKRFQNRVGDFMYKSENRIYGDDNLADEVGFSEVVNKAIEESNQITLKSGGVYYITDEISYSDRGYYKHEVVRDQKDLLQMNDQQFLEYLKYHPSDEDLNFYMKNKDVSKDFIEKIYKEIDYKDIDLLRKYSDKLDWNKISYQIALPFQTLQAFKDKLNWRFIFDSYGSYGPRLYKYKSYVEDLKTNEYPDFDIEEYCKDELDGQSPPSMFGSQIMSDYNDEDNQIEVKWQDSCSLRWIENSLYGSNADKFKNLRILYKRLQLKAAQDYLEINKIRNKNPKQIIENFSEMDEEQMDSFNECLDNQCQEQYLYWGVMLKIEDCKRNKFHADGIFKIYIASNIECRQGNEELYQKEVYAQTVEQLKQKIAELVKEAFGAFPNVY